MANPVTQNPILSRFRAAVAETYGARLERMVLFGPGLAAMRDPIQIMTWRCFLYNMGDLWDELRPLSDLTTDFLVETGEMISAKPFRAGSYNDAVPSCTKSGATAWNSDGAGATHCEGAATAGWRPRTC